MCGRYSFAASKEKLNKQIGIQSKKALKPNYNIAPTHKAYVITNDKPKEIQRLSWGLVPYWARDTRSSANLINARREGIAGKPSFRMPVRKRRCLVLADGFYEWRKDGRKKIPYRITMKDNSIMVFAGVWDEWDAPDGVKVQTFSIITTTPNKEMQDVHARMPVILPLDVQQDWLNEPRLDLVLSMLQTIEDGSLNVFPVSEKVNSVSNNSSELYKPIKLPPTLFD